ncbi:hypothetical protein BESB_070870 [Besnoitia besnoiti]|uniref:Transmembrane protein n=1 Tax=Besnoitia besnoiti TaxID=94643 RepID=A0A2A9M7G7_BESBE|nr:uncharacterized protein BESB_070870 [Besnoitia besnoiti]PFH33935.1 hypothetical protein BESB_070870 [Besnoitia besnoiti]
MGSTRGAAAARAVCVVLAILGSLAGSVSCLVGRPEDGYETALHQELPAGAWKKINVGGCLVGRGANVVVDPGFPNIMESVNIPGFIGGQLCDWLDAQLLRHNTVGRRVLKPPTGFFKFLKSDKMYRFEDHLEVIVTRIDFVNYERVPGVRGHVPLPWMTATFTYHPPTPEFGERSVPFVARGADLSSPTQVHLLITPEISKQLRSLGNYAPGEFPAYFGREANVKEGEELPVHVEQPVLLRSFVKVDGVCAFLDGRLLTADAKLCQWATQWATKYPSASAIMRVQKATLFSSSPSVLLVSIQLQSPEYSSYKTQIPVVLKPSTELAGIFQERYDDLLQKHREL